MIYEVPCECGQKLIVGSTDAGTRKTCACGKSVAIPSLRELRNYLSEEVGPEFKINRLLDEGKLPEADRCLCCDCHTNDVTYFHVTCDSMRPVPIRWWVLVIGALTLGVTLMAFAFMHASRNAPMEGKDIVLILPTRLCSQCRSKLSKKGLIKLLRNVELYKQLLDQYPKSIVRIAIPADFQEEN